MRSNINFTVRNKVEFRAAENCERRRRERELFNERTGWNRTRRQVNGTCVNGERRTRGTEQKGMKSASIQGVCNTETRRERGKAVVRAGRKFGEKRKTCRDIVVNERRRETDWNTREKFLSSSWQVEMEEIMGTQGERLE